ICPGFFVAILAVISTRAAEPDLSALQMPASRLVGVIERFESDRGAMNRSWPVASSPGGAAELRGVFGEWLAALGKLDFDGLSHDDQIDYVLFKAELEYELRQLAFRQKQLDEIAALLPFAQAITDLEEARRRMEKLDPAAAADALN